MIQPKLLAEGKTKRILQDPDDADLVRIESKDDITAGDGAKHDTLEGKAVTATATTCNVFELLENAGIETHYHGRLDRRTFLADRVEMIPLELVTRRVATGSYLKRNPDAAEGEMFEDLVFELFHKDDAAHDPIVEVRAEELVRYPAGEPRGDNAMDSLTYEEAGLRNGAFDLDDLEALIIAVFENIEAAWKEQDVQLVDLKIECGWTSDGRLVVADVIDNDSWRIWPAGDKTRMKDKQVYRDLTAAADPKAKAKELGKIKQNYEWVAEATATFVA